MRRDLERLRLSAERVSSDLRVALGPMWSCSVDDAFVLTVTGPFGTEAAALQSDVVGFFEPEPSWSAEERDGALEQDADDVVASDALEILRVIGVDGPRCKVHDVAMDACSSVWTCPDGHDGPFIGDLGSAS